MQNKLVESVINDGNPSFLNVLGDACKILLTGFMSLSSDIKKSSERKSKLFQYPFGFHFTATSRLPEILSNGLYAPDGIIGQTHFVFLKESNQNLFEDNKMTRDYAFARWLSYFCIEKVDISNSQPALVMVDLDNVPIQRNKRPSESMLQYTERAFVTDRVEEGRILTYAYLRPEEYKVLKDTYPNVRIQMSDYLNRSKPQSNLSDQVGAELFRRMGMQCAHGYFLNIENYRDFCKS